MKDRVDAAILPQVASYYASKLEQHGTTSQGVDWNGTASHDRRHRQFLRLLEGSPNASVIDLGCGFGDFLRFLRSEGFQGRFTGYDIAASMIEKARELYGEGEDRQWRIGSEPEEVADFAIASGIFNVKGDVPAEAWIDYVNDTLDTLARAGRRGFAFNILSLSSDPERRRPHLYYADPVAMLRHCLAKYGRSVALLQDYELYEFTVLVRHPDRG
ncbi:methyltransferase domain-containing protein [Bradyrhizobium sp. CIAT3101]|uniref:class I SAM-dependent methyltransferase n=1 Tax=Bradyrhizobium sp. CIAT3101 TaxID=439387 RepID=UPI0024B1A073|nr:class I SAM-dependent methyltransferase [Bradyrhizobium sp. CIAT3101]WFU83855.1 methyltransferase domain-containing protein [Bradyrhizobium sp. CIAT3101]